MHRYLMAALLLGACAPDDPELVSVSCETPVEPHESAFPTCYFETCCYHYADKDDRTWSECYVESTQGGTWDCEGRHCGEELINAAWRTCRYGNWWERGEWEAPPQR